MVSDSRQINTKQSKGKNNTKTTKQLKERQNERKATTTNIKQKTTTKPPKAKILYGNRRLVSFDIFQAKKQPWPLQNVAD